jgi:hypothetical protein
MELVFIVRDQEAVGSNPIAPTNLLESATYITLKSEERLVRQPSVCARYPLDQTALCPLISLPCNRSFALLEIRFSGNYVQDQLFGKKIKSASSSASCQDTLLLPALIGGNHRRKCLSLRLCGRRVLLSVTRANRGGLPPSISSLVRNQWQAAMELLTSQDRPEITSGLPVIRSQSRRTPKELPTCR